MKQHYMINHEQAYKHGWDAYVSGLDFIDNPFSMETGEGESWEDGWFDAAYNDGAI